MDLDQTFQHTKGSVIGATHRNNYKNNQDFHWVLQNEKCVVAIVGDGCGSGAHSEVGSGLMIPFIAGRIYEILNDKDFTGTIDDAIKYSLLAATSFMINSGVLEHKIPLTGAQVIENYFLFTIMGTIVTPEETVVFSMGDGVNSINGSVHVIDQNNTPNYLAYTLINGKDPEYVINVKMPTEAVDSIIIASDGATDLINNKNQQVKFGVNMKEVGDITQFVEGKFKGSSVKMIKHLNVLSKQNVINDDTTIVTITRITPEGE